MIFIPFALAAPFTRSDDRPEMFRLLQDMNGAVLFSGVLLLAALSTMFDFHDCVYPSRQFPYFISGRLISGILVPFLFLYMEGFNEMLKKIKRENFFLPLAMGAGLWMLGSEIWVYWPVFRSPYNFFHLL